MARKGRDLFEILGKRAVGESTIPKRSKKKAKAEVATPLEVGRGIADAVGSLFRSADTKKAKSKRSNASQKPSLPAGATLPGLALALVALICLSAGFAVGRFTAGPSADDNSELRKKSSSHTSARATKPPETPAYIAPGKTYPEVAELSAEEISEKLSLLIYPLLKFAPANREAAVQAVNWFRQRDFMTTRLLSGTPKNGERQIYVVCYVKEESQTHVRNRLMALDLSAAGTPNPILLKDYIQNLKKVSKPVKLRS